MEDECGKQVAFKPILIHDFHRILHLDVRAQQRRHQSLLGVPGNPEQDSARGTDVEVAENDPPDCEEPHLSSLLDHALFSGQPFAKVSNTLLKPSRDRLHDDVPELSTPRPLFAIA